MNQTKRIGSYVGATCLVSWGLLAGYLYVGGGWNTSAAMVVAVAYMYGPCLVGLVVTKAVEKKGLQERLGIKWKINWWWLAAWLLPVAVAFVTLGVSLVWPGLEYSPEVSGLIEQYGDQMTAEQLEQLREQAEQLPVHPFWVALFQGLVAGATINAVVAFGEEVGWRGWLYDETREMGFWRSSWLVGGVWGVWHAPLILMGHNYPQHPVAGMFMMIVFTLLWSPLFTFVRDRTKTVFGAALLHGTLNGVGGLTLMVVVGGTDLTMGFTGVVGLVALGILNLGLVFVEGADEPESS